MADEGQPGFRPGQNLIGQTVEDQIPTVGARDQHGVQARQRVFDDGDQQMRRRPTRGDQRLSLGERVILVIA